MYRLRGKPLRIMPFIQRFNLPNSLELERNERLALSPYIFAYQALRKLKDRAIFKLNTIFLSERHMCTNPNGKEKKRKPNFLMKFEPILRPEVLLTLKNWILTKLIVQPYLDSDFTLKDFTAGAKQALEVVSSYLSQGDFQSLQGLITDDALLEIKKNYAHLNIKERQDLYIKVSDILFAFPHQVGIFFDDDNKRRFAEITVVYHCLNGFEELKSQGRINPIAEDSKDDFKICNYRFIREYTKDVQSDWTINRLGHFKLEHFK